MKWQQENQHSSQKLTSEPWKRFFEKLKVKTFLIFRDLLSKLFIKDPLHRLGTNGAQEVICIIDLRLKTMLGLKTPLGLKY